MSVVHGDDKIPYIDLGKDYKIRLAYEDIVDEKYLAKAKDELRETPEIKAQALKDLKELIKNEKNFVHPLEDTFLEPYLRTCKYYPKSAFEKIQKFYKLNLKRKNYCENLQVDPVRKVYEDGALKLMPLRDKEGRRIIYFYIGKAWDPQRFNIIELCRAFQIIIYATMTEPLTQVNGVSYLVNFDGLSASHLFQFTPSLAAVMLELIQGCMPMRLKQIYIVNNPKIFNVLFTIFKPFVSRKLGKRIQFINKHYDVLGEHLGKFCLDKEFNGDLPVDYADGKLLADLLKHYEKQYELIGISGYIDGNIEERREKVKAYAKEALNCMKPTQ